MKKNLTNILLVVILLAGAAILLYPTFSDYWNSFHQSRAIASYSDSVASLNEADYERIWQDAVAYNTEMSGKSIPYTLSEEEWADYEAKLNFAGNGIMGYIDIPKINVSLPIYHGTSESVLQIATGHIESSSLPVGGPSTLHHLRPPGAAQRQAVHRPGPNDRGRPFPAENFERSHDL